MKKDSSSESNHKEVHLEPVRLSVQDAQADSKHVLTIF